METLTVELGRPRVLGALCFAIMCEMYPFPLSSSFECNTFVLNRCDRFTAIVHIMSIVRFCTLPCNACIDDAHNIDQLHDVRFAPIAWCDDKKNGGNVVNGRRAGDEREMGLMISEQKQQQQLRDWGLDAS